MNNVWERKVSIVPLVDTLRRELHSIEVLFISTDDDLEHYNRAVGSMCACYNACNRVDIK